MRQDRICFTTNYASGKIPPLPLKEKKPQDRIKDIEYSHMFRERPLEYSIFSI